MNFHLNRNGQNLGIFPLEELRRRRRIGELTGTELVWCPGMPKWQTLDAVMAPETPKASSAAPPPIPSSVRHHKPNLVFIWAMVAAGILGVAFVVASAWNVKRSWQRIEAAQGRINPQKNLPVVTKRITWNTNSITEAEVRQRSRAFRIRQWTEGYQQHGQHDQPWDANAALYLQTWIDNNYAGKSATNAAVFHQLGDKIAADNTCNDPLVLTATAAGSIELHESIKRLERAVKGFEQSSYRAYPKLYATVILADQLRDRPERVAALDAAAVRLCKEAFKDGSFQPGDEAEVGEIMVSGWGSTLFHRQGGQIFAAVAEAGPSYRWLALVLEGNYHIEEAWKMRGGGYADTVSASGWQGFNAQLESAEKCLTSAWKMRPEQPLAASLMIKVALGSQGLEDMRLWFDRAVSAQVDYPLAWTQLRWGLRPRWHGSLEAMQALGVAALETKRFDTDVPHKLLDVLRDEESEMQLPAGKHLYARPDIWPLLQRMYEGYLAEPTQADRRDGWRTSYAVVAFLAGKYDVARLQMEALKWQPQSGNLTGWGVDLSLMPSEIAALTGAAGAGLTTAETEYKRGHVETAWKLFSAQSAKTNLDERTITFIHCRIAALEQERRLQKGEWIDFLPLEDNDPNWVRLAGQYHRTADGSLEVQAAPEGHLTFSRVRVGSEFEVKGEFEIVQTSDRSFQAGLVMGTPNLESLGWYGFRLKRNETEGEVASLGLGWSIQQRSSHVTLDDHHNTFQFRFHQGKGSVWLNGKEVLHEAVPPRKISLSNREFFVGLGAFNDMNHTVIRYRNLQVRRLSSAASIAQK